MIGVVLGTGCPTSPTVFNSLFLYVAYVCSTQTRTTFLAPNAHQHVLQADPTILELTRTSQHIEPVSFKKITTLNLVFPFYYLSS